MRNHTTDSKQSATIRNSVRSKKQNKICTSLITCICLMPALVVPTQLAVAGTCIYFAVQNRPLSEDYYLLLPSNDTFSFTIDNPGEYDAIKLELLNGSEQEIEIFPSSEAISNQSLTEVITYSKNGPVKTSANTQIIRYWPNVTQLSLEGSIHCVPSQQKESEIFITWKWSKLKKLHTRNTGDTYSADCSKERKIQCFDNGTFNFSNILNADMDIIAITFCKSESEKYQYYVVFKEERYSSKEKCNTYKLGHKSTNPKSVKIPLNKKDKYLNMVVYDTNSTLVTSQIQVTSIPDDERMEIFRLTSSIAIVNIVVSIVTVVLAVIIYMLYLNFIKQKTL